MRSREDEPDCFKLLADRNINDEYYNDSIETANFVNKLKADRNHRHSVDDNTKSIFDIELTLNLVESAILQFKNNKSPGLDNIPTDPVKKWWKALEYFNYIII